MTKIFKHTSWRASRYATSGRPKQSSQYIAEALERRLQLSAAPFTVSNGSPLASNTADNAQPVNFGVAAQNAAGPFETFTITNASGGNLSVGIVDGGVPDFTFDTTSLTMNADGDTATFKMTLITTEVGVHVDIVKIEGGGAAFNFPVEGTVLPPDLGTVGTTAVTAHGVVSARDNSDTFGNPRATETNQFARFELTSQTNLLTLGVDSTLAAGEGLPMDLQVQVLPAPNGAEQPDGTQTPLFTGTITTAADGDTGSLQTQLTLPAGSYFVALNVADINEITFVGGNTETYTATLSSTPLNPGISIASGGHAISNGDTTPSSVDGTDLGSADEGTAAPVSTFIVTNTGDGQLTLGSPTFGGASFDVEQAPPATLAPGASGTFKIGLLTNAPGLRTDTLTLATNVNGENQFTFAVAGTVLPPPGPSLEVLDGSRQISNGQATAIDFGSATVGDPAPTQTFTVTNNGTAALTTQALSVPAGFTLLGALAPSIAPGTSASFTVQLDTSAAGSPSGQIMLTSNDLNAANFAFPVSGTVTATAPAGQSLGVTQVTSVKIPPSVVGGQKTSKGTALVTLKNISGALLPGSAAVTVFASPVAGSVGAGSLTLGHAAARLKLKVNQSQVVKVNITIPSVSADGTFFLVAQVTGTGVTAPGGVVGSSAGPIAIRAPFVSLQGPGAAGGLSATRGKPLTLPLVLSNQGNVAATGAVSLDLLLSPDGTMGSSTLLTTLGQKINLKPNATKALKLKVTIPPAASAGSFVLLVRCRGNGPLAALNLLDGHVVGSFLITIT